MYPLPGTTEIPKQSIQTTEQSNVGDRASKGPDKPGMISMVDTLPDYFKAVKAKGGPNATNSNIGGEIRSYAYHLSIDYRMIKDFGTHFNSHLNIILQLCQKQIKRFEVA